MVTRAIAAAGSATVFRFSVQDCPEDLRVVRLEGHEGLSRLFEFVLELSCSNPDLNLDDIVAKPALLTIEGEESPRLVHGIVSRFEVAEELAAFTRYRARLVPLVWRLALRHDCRIFQELTTQLIVQQVLERAGMTSREFEFRLAGTYDPRNYCAQYRESDWDFVSRLLEEDGIFFFFEHHDDRDVLVMGDAPDAYVPMPGSPTLPFRPPGGEVATEDHVEQFQLVQELRPGQVELRDFKFKQPRLVMDAKETASVATDLTVYDYPGEYQDPGSGSPAKGKTIAKVRLEALRATSKVVRGRSDCERLAPGFLFTLDEHPRADVNVEYLVVSVGHEGHQSDGLDAEGEGGFRYSNSFMAIPSDVPFRPPRITPRPRIAGVQTAIVVGPDGEEIYVDEHGRVKVRFHWDRDGEKRPEDSSCWVRVSQPTAGAGWGGLFLPRIGQEVVVEFIEGDPDRPLVTGRVYNADNPLPYPLPDEKTKSTMKSNSSPGKDGFNEIRFEDAAGSEELFVHAQKDMNVTVLNNRTESVGVDESVTVGSNRTLNVGSNQTTEIGANLQETVGANETWNVVANATKTIGGNQSVTVGASATETIAIAKALTIGAAYQVSVGGALNETVAGLKAEEIGGAKSVNVGAVSSENVAGKRTVDAGASISHSAGTDVTSTAGKNVALKAGQDIAASAGKDVALKSGGNFVVDCGKKGTFEIKDELVLKCGSATVVLKKNGDITIKGKKISINGSGDVVVKGSKISNN